MLFFSVYSFFVNNYTRGDFVFSAQWVVLNGCQTNGKE